MKKLKFLPTILMLVLCVGILAIGIYAVKPTENNISGSVTVNASTGVVAIKAYKDSQVVFDHAEVRGGVEMDFGTMALDTSTANVADDVKEIRLTFEVTNKSTSPMGMYFALPTVEKGDGVLATASDVLLTKTENGVKFNFSSYTPILAQGTEEMAISIILTALSETDKTVPLNFKLFIEPYEANHTTTNEGLVKVAPGTATYSYEFLDGSTIVALPRGTNWTSGFSLVKATNIASEQITFLPNVTSVFYVPSYCTTFNPKTVLGGGDPSYTISSCMISVNNQNYSSDRSYSVFNKNQTELLIFTYEPSYLNGAAKTLKSLPSTVAKATFSVITSGNEIILDLDLSTTSITECNIDFSTTAGSCNIKICLPNILTKLTFGCSADGGGSCEVICPMETPPATFTFSCNLFNTSSVLKVPSSAVSKYSELVNTNSVTVQAIG